MKTIFTQPSVDDLVYLLKAWRFWVVGALVGALIGALVYIIAPPPYRAHAVVLVDFNLEDAWPQETDRQQFYYLEREVRKLEEIAYSDDVMNNVLKGAGEFSNAEFQLSQPSNGGWNFYVDDRDADQAAMVANLWANTFTEQVNMQTSSESGLSGFIEAKVMREALTPIDRSVSRSIYIFSGAAGLLVFATLLILLSDRPK